MAGFRDSDDGRGLRLYLLVLLATDLALSSRRVSLVVATPGLTSYRLSVQWKESSVRLARLGAQTRLRSNHCSQGPAVH